MTNLTLSICGPTARPEPEERPVETCAAHGLERLSRPTFFAGQLLTDQDLRRLADYTRQRLRLAGYRAPWGVVCGLETYRHPTQPGQLVVCPGYAVDSCGNDLVVANPLPLDLARECKAPPTGCDDLSTTDAVAAETTVSYGAFPVTGRLQSVDIWLCANEVYAGPQRPLRNGDDARPAAYSRIDERPALKCTPSADTDAALREARKRRATAYDRHGSDLISACQQLNANVVALLEGALAAEPPRAFGFVERLIGDKKYDAALFWIVQDRRNHLLRHTCAQPDDDRAVPLARVRLEYSKDCSILSIDAQPPYRRMFGVSPAPAADGTIDLSGLIWMRRTEAMLTLADLGLQARFDDLDSINATAVETLKQPYPAIPADKPLVVTTVDTKELGTRVIGIRAASTM